MTSPTKGTTPTMLITITMQNMVDMYPCVRMMSDYQEVIELWISVFRLTIAWVGVCATCRLSRDVQVLSIEMVDNNGEGQASLCRWTEGGDGRTWRLGSRDRGPGDGPWMASMWRCRLTKSRWVCEDLVIGWLRTSGDTRRDCRAGVVDMRPQLGLAVSASKPWAVEVCQVWASKPWAGSQGGMWRHQRACLKAKHLHEGLVAIHCKELNLDHFAPMVKWFRENI
jgi:hypothetical protein